MTQPDPVTRCVTCGHREGLHFGEGFFDEVTEPEHRPSRPTCEECQYDRTSADDTRHLHPFKPEPTQGEQPPKPALKSWEEPRSVRLGRALEREQASRREPMTRAEERAFTEGYYAGERGAIGIAYGTDIPHFYDYSKRQRIKVERILRVLGVIEQEKRQ